MSLVAIIILLIGVETDYVKSPSAGDGGKAVGVLQIQPVMVAEVNRILGSSRYSPQDRHSRTKSMEIASTFLSYQIKRYRARYGEEPSAFRLMQSWNTGSIFRSAPTRYRERVNRYLDGHGSRVGHELIIAEGL